MLSRLTVLLKAFLWILIFWAAGRGDPQAFNAHITEDPTKILQKYLSLDKKGVRLEAYSWQVMKPLVAWKEEPLWGHVVVISQFEVVDDVTQWEILDSLEAKIPVIFEVVGTMYWESATFAADLHREIHLFHIKAVQDRWQIVGPQLPPHVGHQRLIDFVRWAELNESDQGKKHLFGSLKVQLKRQSEKD
jgi:hypothetical protein